MKLRPWKKNATHGGSWDFLFGLVIICKTVGGQTTEALGQKAPKQMNAQYKTLDSWVAACVPLPRRPGNMPQWRRRNEI